MDLKIQDKVIIVTGGASGIGEAIVRGLVLEDAFPVIIDKNQKEGVRIVDELKSTGHNVHLVVQDLNSAESCREAVGQVVQKTGRIDGIINNAGINDAVGLEQGKPDEFLASLGRNLHHYYFMAQACLPELKKRKGVIINISSKTALTGQGGTSGYTASKGGQLALTREWAVELLKYDIRVNAIIPAEVMTPLYKNWLENKFDDPAEQQNRIEKRIPLGNRFTKPEEIADMALFLLSPRAGHITGQYIHVDGGYVHLDRAL